MIENFTLNTHGHNLRLKKISTPSDIQTATDIINKAFAVWAPLGIKPHSLEVTTSYLLPDGYAITSQDQIIGTLCMREAKPHLEGDTIQITRPHKIDQAVLYDKSAFLKQIENKRIVYGYGFSIDPEQSRSGLGQALIVAFEQLAKNLSYHILMLETGKDSHWLVAWYKKVGFQIIAESDPLTSKIATIMMTKEI